mmetsp:Transcript_42517/g.30683  ORF Transcript_42517/g.30683 Transcript_42517/m.30683 type:complete len:169 (+) Transcript_42517:34-540(+)
MEDAEKIRKLITDVYEMWEYKPQEADSYLEDAEGMEFDLPLHKRFMFSNFKRLPGGMVGADSGQPWFLFWLTQGLEVANVDSPLFQITPDMKSRMCAFLRKCWNDKEGGFSGAPFLQSHLASTYAAVLSIVNIGTEEAYDLIDVEGMRKFLLSIKNNLHVEYDNDSKN